MAAVFSQIRPDLIYFNIHPAKREARFSDISALHHGLSSTIRTFFHQYTYSNFAEDKPADENRVQEFDFTTPDQGPAHNENPAQSVTTVPAHSVSPASEQSVSPAAYGSEKTATGTVPGSFYERHISYKPSETKSESLSDFRSKYLGIKTGDGSRSNTLWTPGGGNSQHASERGSGNLGSTRSLAEAALAAAAGGGAQAAQSDANSQNTAQTANVRFIGSCLGTFLLAEKNNCLYLIDQHAVHERILFDRLMNSQGNSGRQPLLIPYKIRTESKTQDNQLEKLKTELNRIGFETEHTADGLWEITTIPERWTGTEYELRTLLFVKQVEPKEIIRSIAAMTACKAAVKDGYVLDDITAARLVEQAFTLEDPHCPHGRPIYTVISREKLFELVKRT